MIVQGDPRVMLSAEGSRRLEAELQRVRDRQEEVTALLQMHAADSDSMASAETVAVRAELAHLQARERELTQLLAEGVIVEPTRADGAVTLGSRVTAVDTTGAEEIIEVVGPGESDPRRGLISYEAPLGQALFGRRVGDQVEVQTPDGPWRLEIVAIA